MPDGDIQLTVSLTATDIKQTASQLRGEIEKIFKANAGKELTASMKSVMAQMDKMVSKSTELENKLRDMDRANLNNITQGWKETESILRSAYQDLEKIDAKKDPKGFEQARKEVEKWESALRQIEAEYDHIKQYGSSGMPEYDKVAQQLSEVNNQMAVLKTRAEQVGSTGNSVDVLGSALEKASDLADKMNKAIISAVKKGISGIRNLASTIKNNLVKAFNKVKTSIDKAFSSKTMKRNLTTLLKYTLGVRSLYFAFRKLRSAVKEGLNNLVQFESETNLTNQQMTEFKTSLLYLKNAWGAAFAPVINVVMPILTALIDMLASVANAIARFIASLTGQATVIQALRVGVGDYAKSLQGAGGSAKKAADEQKKLNDRLASFDDLIVLGKDKEDDSSSGGGGGASTPSVNDMFETIDTPLNDLARRLREAWDNGDFFGLGEILGEALKEQLLKIDAWLTGEGREIILGWGEKIGQFIDGFISVDELAKTIADVIAHGIEDGIDFVDEIITPERFYKIGEFIVEGFNEFIPIVVPKLGELFGNLLHSAISLAYGFISDADFKGWGKAIGASIRNFFAQMARTNEETGLTGWQELGESLSKGAIGLLDMIIEAINGLNPVQIRHAIEQFLEKVDWEGIKGKLKELWDALWETLGEIFPEIDFDGLKKNIESIISTITELVKDIPWDTIGSALLSITNFLAGLDADTVESTAKAFVALAGAIEVIGSVAKIIMGLGLLSKGAELIGLSSVLGEIGGFFSDLVVWIPEVLSGLTAVVGIIVSWREAIKEFQGAGGFEGLFDFLTSSLDEKGIAGIADKIGELLLGAFGTGLDNFRTGLDALINSDNPLEVLWASLTNDDDFLTGWADDLAQNAEDWDTWAGGLITSAEGVLGIIERLADTDMTTLLTDMWEGIDVVSPLSDIVNNWDGAKIDEAITNLATYIGNSWSKTFGSGDGKVDVGASLTGLFDNLDTSKLEEFIAKASESWNTFKSNTEATVSEFKSNISATFADFRDTFTGIVDTVKDKLDGWKENFSTGITFIKDTASEFKTSFLEGFEAFKQDFIEGLEAVKEGLDFTDVLNALPSVFRGGLNGVIDVINSFLNILAQGINGIGNLLGDLEFDNPVTGTHYSLNIPTVSAIQIPHLAQGAVIPPNREFMAVLGDQSSGTNIEAPLDTIKQAVGEEFAPYADAIVEAVMQVVSAVNNKELKIGDKEIGRANDRYNNQRSIIRGTML